MVLRLQGGQLKHKKTILWNCRTWWLSVFKNQDLATVAEAAVAQSKELPELRSLREVHLSDVNSNPGSGKEIV